MAALQVGFHADSDTAAQLTRNDSGRHWLVISDGWQQEIALYLDEATLAKIHAATAPEVKPVTAAAPKVNYNVRH